MFLFEIPGAADISVYNKEITTKSLRVGGKLEENSRRI